MEKSKKETSSEETLEVQLARKQHTTSYKIVEEKFKGQSAPMFTDNSTG